MTRTSDMVSRIQQAVDGTEAVVGAIGDTQWHRPTPCPGWDVRAELNHVVGGIRIYAAELTGGEAGAAHEADWLGDDPRGAFARAAELDRAAWRRPDALDGEVRLGFGTVPAPMAAQIHLTELMVHGVDLAVAVGAERLIDEVACARLLAEMRAMDFGTFRRPGMFGPEIPAPAGAPAHRGLLAFLGRDLAAAA
ncbi:TIGR03086 family metal-binding protein [Streptomyces sp. VRA16 Mangrove soil]|uniref:TIGR03086 family metal-binding protein n=1 Tax=Streptomyces sp. VRA16 Mangrove soil TaxID=2817434 RepID=UPI001A9F0BB5|nr:TIGR03086 family metal-binding protein [Streptomyces sp. VRA16 Mangrove soil]MBO1334920.1 TIGR03086 family protein [Streptomyces sp. VRA16 Mangrove soil]